MLQALHAAIDMSQHSLNGKGIPFLQHQMNTLGLRTLATHSQPHLQHALNEGDPSQELQHVLLLQQWHGTEQGSIESMGLLRLSKKRRRALTRRTLRRSRTHRRCVPQVSQPLAHDTGIAAAPDHQSSCFGEGFGLDAFLLQHDAVEPGQTHLAEGTETIQEIGGAMAESCDGTDLKELLPPLLQLLSQAERKQRCAALNSSGASRSSRSCWAQGAFVVLEAIHALQVAIDFFGTLLVVFLQGDLPLDFGSLQSQPPRLRLFC
mmetsp:Transcript_41923/g.90895  ORF Transcript_41923/g.90895 Transcript_41923/m.90895 type:complete len:263 (-) Transcript_41923:502-1290(-)